MISFQKKIHDTLRIFFSRRKNAAAAHEPKDSNDPAVFDTITLESILSLRGRSAFPEEEGEIGLMNHTLHQRSLHSR
jgi:hypothetical protein